MNAFAFPNKTHEVADIFRLYGKSYREHYRISQNQHKVMHHISICRTPVLGGHIDRCNECGFEQRVYNSCRNRHCPKCQTLAKERWLNARRAELLPTGYFHLVFTLPHLLNPLILYNKKIAFNILFAAANETLQAFAQDPQWRLVGQLGFIAVLHTWSQTLIDHFHLHCLIPAGVLSVDNKQWIQARKKFLFRTASLAKEFRKQYLLQLELSYKKNILNFPEILLSLQTPEGFTNFIGQLKTINWIAYAKHPFAGADQVLEYLGRYTHRVAISNERIKSISNQKIIFTYKDRKNNNQKKLMQLHADEFIRRFLLHVLPCGFTKIRYFGFLAHRNKNQSIALIRKLLGEDKTHREEISETIQQVMFRLTGKDIALCPCCKKGHLREILHLPNLTVLYNLF